jgi:hypothetical protein
MATPLKPSKPTVQLQPAQRPSRIRREPAKIVMAHQLSRDAWWESREWEIRLAVVGIIFFAVAISAVVIDLGHLFGM